MPEDENTEVESVGNDDRKERTMWRAITIAAGLLLLVVVNAGVIGLYVHESRPRKRVCRGNIEKLAELIDKYTYYEETGKLPPLEGNELIEAFRKADKKTENNVVFEINDEKLKLFKCPFSDSRPGESDYVGLNAFTEKKKYAGLPILWERKVFHGGGRHVVICKDDLSFEVKFLEEEKFQEQLEKLEKAIRDDSKTE